MKFRFLAVLAIILVVGSLLLTAGSSIIWPDRSVPAPYSEHVAEARAAVREHVEGLRWPHFRLIEIRCRRDGGMAYVFDQIEAPYLNTRYAFALTPTWPPSGWSVGVTLTERRDPELRSQLGTDEVPCTVS